MERQLTLNDLQPGGVGIVSQLKANDTMRRRLLDIGLIENTAVECIGKSPLGDPHAFIIRGAVIAIRSEDCKNILIK